jgi:hypothetical protein
MSGNTETIILRDDLEEYIRVTEGNFATPSWHLVFKHKSIRIWKYLLSRSFECPNTRDLELCFIDALRNKRWDVIALALPCVGIKTIYDWMYKKYLAQDITLSSYLLTKGILVSPPDYKCRPNSVKSALLITIGWSCRNDCGHEWEVVDGIWGRLNQHLNIVPNFFWEISDDGFGYCDLSYYDNILNLGRDLHRTIRTFIREGSPNWMKRLLSQITKHQLSEREQQDIFEMALSPKKVEMMKLLREKGIPSTIAPEYRALGDVLSNW